MENAVLRSQGLTKRYGSKLALDNLDLTLPEGKIIGLLGPNGSGKTTFIKLAAGLLSPTAGSVTVCGKPIGPDSKAMVSYLPDKTYFNKQQKIRDLLTLFQDEPIGGVDPAARDYILNTIISNYDPSATVLISTHLIADVERVLDEFLFLYEGRVIRQGTADQVREETGKSLDELFREVFKCLPNC